jgi:predicted TIM-barrel fold metal-dependent hydrolase
MKREIPIIDAHALLGAEYHLTLTADELLRRMDAHDVELSIARPVGAELAVYNAEGNDRVLKAHPRIRGMVSVNPWYGSRAIEELKRCRDLGAVGLFLHPSRQGFMPTDEHVRPMLEFAVQANWPVLFHTGTYIQSDILAVGEVARKYPQTNFIAGFGGFTDMWFELPGVFAEVPNLHLDASLMWSSAIAQIIRERGASRVLYGSAEPRNRYAVSLKALARLDLPGEQLRAVLCENARRVFRLP